MRVIRSLILLLGFAIAVAGCAQQQAAYMAYPGGGYVGPAYPNPGIDSVVYGGFGGASAPAFGYGPSMQAGMQTGPPPVQQAAAQNSYGGLYGYAGAPAPGAAGYLLDSGDRLRVVVFGQEGLTNSYIVDAGGSIDMPLIGQVPARGATTDALAGRIAARLRDGFIREPHVAVEVEAYRPFFILGEVTQPGQYPYVANMTAETAIAIAGGFTPRAMRKSVILNRNFYGQQVRLSVPLTFPLRPGDTINVQERWF